MKIFDTVNKAEVEVNGTDGLVQLMKDGRQVDLYLKEKKWLSLQLYAEGCTFAQL